MPQPTTQNGAQRAAKAYRHALAIKEFSAAVAPDFPKVAAVLEQAAKSLISEGKKSEAE